VFSAYDFTHSFAETDFDRNSFIERALGECKKCCNAQTEDVKTFIEVPKAGRPKKADVPNVSEVKKEKTSREPSFHLWVPPIKRSART
jgi:hypothetical protein